MRRVGRCGAWAALSVLLGACEPGLIDLEVTGRVTDGSTGEPIAGAPVILTWSRGFGDLDAVGTESGADGHYRLLVFRFPCDAPALAAGLDPYEFETVDVKCVEGVQTVDFALTKGGFALASTVAEPALRSYHVGRNATPSPEISAR